MAIPISGGVSNALAEVKAGTVLPSTSDTAVVVTTRDTVTVSNSSVTVLNPSITVSNSSVTILNASVTTQDTSSLADNAAFTDGTSKVLPSGYIFDEVAGTALTENDVAAARVDSKRAVVNVIEDATTRGTRATIKAASTAAQATDTAFVVAVSPNNTVAVGNSSVTVLNPSITVSNSSVTILNASLTTQDSSSLADNAPFTDGTSRVLPSGYIFDETPGTALTENDVGAARVDSKRAVVNVIEDATTRGTRATVKAASTAAVASDPAFVVAVSPNNTVGVTTAITATTSTLLAAQAATATTSNVSSTTGNVTLLAANAARKMALFFNDSTSNLFLKFGATASATSFTVKVLPAAYFEMPAPVYTGIIDGLWSATNGAVRVTEET